MLPINLAGVTRIFMESNLAVYNLPITGRIACIPLTANYGELFQYDDKMGGLPHLIMDQDISHLHIRLLDQESKPLTDWLDPDYPYLPPWKLTITLEPLHNEGFIPLDV